MSTYIPVLIRPQVFLFFPQPQARPQLWPHRTSHKPAYHTAVPCPPSHPTRNAACLHITTVGMPGHSGICCCTHILCTAPGLWLLWGHCLNLLRTCPAPWWPLPEPPPWKYSIHLLGLLSHQRSLAQNSLPLKVNYPIRTPKLSPTPVRPLRSGRAAKPLQIEKLIVPLNLGWVF